MSVESASDIGEVRRGEYLVSTNPALLDLDVIHGFLADCYWAKGIPRELVARAIDHSLCFGIYHESAVTSDPETHARKLGRTQVGFARVVSDFATVAYQGDVFILGPHRGRGLSKWMMECIMQHPQLQGLRRWILLTRDAHRLYERFGFTPVKAPERYMELHRPDIYGNKGSI